MGAFMIYQNLSESESQVHVENHRGAKGVHDINMLIPHNHNTAHHLSEDYFLSLHQ